jgi:hypothetical protein
MDALTDFQKEYLASLIEEEKEELEEHSELIDSFKEYLSKLNICVEDVNFQFYRTIGITANYPNLINPLHPSLIEDKEGLFDFRSINTFFEIKPFLNGYLFASNFMLMANSYFRRSFDKGNNYSPRFIELFWNFNDPNIEKYISLDTDRVRINVNDIAYMERDTWYGAQFNKDVGTISDGIVKLRPPLDLRGSIISFFFNDAYSLDIKWATKNNIKSFQAEEFKTESVTIIKDGIMYYPVRYVHAEFDLEKRYFRHFDGAIHFYNANEYFSRRDSDFNYNFKNSNHIKTLSQKLFKMNGTINVETWVEFTSHFFTGNPLVFEYFEGKYPKHVEELVEKVRRE